MKQQIWSQRILTGALTFIAVMIFGAAYSANVYAESANVICNGTDDQDKFTAVLAAAIGPDLTINISGDCVFTSALALDSDIYSGLSNVTINGNGNTIYGIGTGYYGVIYVDDVNNTGLSAAIKNVTIDGSDAGALSYGVASNNTMVTLQNVTITNFAHGLYGDNCSDEFGVSDANNCGFDLTDVLITGLAIVDEFGGTPVSAAIITYEQVVRWHSGRSDAVVAWVLFLDGVTLENNLATALIAGGPLTDTDVQDISGGYNVAFATWWPINSIVNCGFPAGSQWDICNETGGEKGEEEQDVNGAGGNDETPESEVEAPKTGVLSALSAGAVGSALVSAAFGALVALVAYFRRRVQ